MAFRVQSQHSKMFHSINFGCFDLDDLVSVAFLFLEVVALDVEAVDLEVVAEDVAFLDPPARLEDEGVFRTVSAKVPKAFSKSGFLLIKSRLGQLLNHILLAFYNQ